MRPRDVPSRWVKLLPWAYAERRQPARAIALQAAIDDFWNPPRTRGVCPRGTPGCTYADCCPAVGYSCFGPDAPPHADMSL